MTNAGAARTVRTGRALLSAAATAIASLFRSGGQQREVALAGGDVAPDFTLRASDGETYRLADLAGRPTVIAWFPKAFTSGCTAECAAIGLASHALERFDAQLFAASCDDVETNREFAASTGIEVPILSDPGSSVARDYGVLGSYGLPRRWTFYIGPDRRILRVDRHVRTTSHGADIVAALEQLGVSRRP